MAYQESASRRVSTSTTAPRLPENRRSHRNQKRSWPGAPNRYSTMRSFKVIRPKSKATVVVNLSATPPASSIPMPARVIVSSVLSGRISLTELTMVVLPTPNPPTTTILSPVSIVLRSGTWVANSELAESNEHLLQGLGVGKLGGRRGGRVACGDLTGVEQVAQQDLHHADGQPQRRGDFGHRHRPGAHLDDPYVLRLHAGRGVALAHDQRDEVERVLVRATAPAGDGIQPVGVLVVERPRIHADGLCGSGGAGSYGVFSSFGGFADRCCAGRRGGAVMYSPICSTNSFML